jgi:hypothetical protein
MKDSSAILDGHCEYYEYDQRSIRVSTRQRRCLGSRQCCGLIQRHTGMRYGELMHFYSIISHEPHSFRPVTTLHCCMGHWPTYYLISLLNENPLLPITPLANANYIRNSA